MSFLDRTYPDIVRDVLTTLTLGVVQEHHRIEYDPKARPLRLPEITLHQRPVRRVSFVSGFVAAGDDAPPSPTVFSLHDYELVPDSADPTALNTLRFLPFGKKPAAGTVLTVNYYPRTAEAAPLTDLNVGSVVRTVLEAVSREFALLYSQLNLVYDAAFVGSASGADLDRVVALLGLSRFKAGRAVGTVTVQRSPRAVGNITIPAGTPITDSQDRVRYETAENRDLLAGETSAQIRIRASSTATPPVEAHTLTILQRVIAGIASITNERPTTRASEDETDDDLRARARAALTAANKGTVEALTHGLLALPEVRDVKVVEMPAGVPGEIQILISRADGQPASAPLPRAILDRIESLRPAGIRVVPEVAQPVRLAASVRLTLAGSSLSGTALQEVHTLVRRTLASNVAQKGVGERIRVKPLVAALLSDKRLVDAEITLAPVGAPPPAGPSDFDPPAGSIVALAEEDIAFEADVFEQATPPGTAAVQVQARLNVQVLAGVSLDSARARLQSALNQLFQNLSPGTALDAQSVLNALREDTLYAIDPLTLKITLAAGPEFAEIAQGTPPYTVGPGQSFQVNPAEILS